MLVKGTFYQQVEVDPREAFEKLKVHLGFGCNNDFFTIREGVLLRGEDVSYHGSSVYEYEEISNNPNWISLYNSVNMIQDYLNNPNDPKWQRHYNEDEMENLKDENSIDFRM